MTRLSDKHLEIALEFLLTQESESDMLTRACLDLRDARAELDTLRKSRNHASSYLDCSEHLKTARDALEFYAGARHFEDGIVSGTYWCEPIDTGQRAREALTKIGELKSPKQALEKGNG